MLNNFILQSSTVESSVKEFIHAHARAIQVKLREPLSEFQYLVLTVHKLRSFNL